MERKVILVDFHDRPLGEMGKGEAHQAPRLHRAFSVFLYQGSKMLIQQRAMGKYHCPGIWANTCCSHPMPGEDTAQAARRRLKEETGITHEGLQELFAFTYCAPFENGLWEYEYDHVYVGEYGGEFLFDPEEVARMEWVEIEELLEDMVKQPSKYAPWFLIAAPRVIQWIETGKSGW